MDYVAKVFLLPSFAQRAIHSAISLLGRHGLSKRTAGLPPKGADAATQYLAVLRVPGLAVPILPVEQRHHRYPANTCHVTVADLDGAPISAEKAVAKLQTQELHTVELHIDGYGVTADTIFLRTTYKNDFVVLQRQVRKAFGLSNKQGGILGRLFAHALIINVVRFDGKGEEPPNDAPFDADIEAATLEIVRTDRYLSDEGTTVVATIPLSADHSG